MKKRSLAVLMATAMVVSSLVACGGGSSSSSSETTAAAAEEAAPAETSEAAVLSVDEAGEASGEEVTLRVSLWDYSNTEYYKNMFNAFMEKYPNITIDVVEFSADEYDNVIVTQLSGKQNFDVVFTKGTPALSALISQGHIYALDDLIAADPDFDPANYKGLVDQLGLNGHTYALPYRYDNQLIYYNKDLFDKAGVAYPEDGMTIEQYHELATKMTSGEGNDKVFGAHAHTWTSSVYMYTDRTGEFNYVDPSTYEVLIPYYNEFLAMQDEGVIQDYGELKSANLHYSGVFYNQQAAMMQMGTWYINMLLENVPTPEEDPENGFNWGVCALPNDAGILNENSVGGVTPVSIGAYGEHPAEAWQFIKYICGPEGAAVLAENGIVPGLAADEVLDIFDALPEKYPNAPEGLSKYLSCENALVEQPMHEKGKEISTIMDEQHSAIMTKSVSAEEGVQGMIDRVNEVIGG